MYICASQEQTVKQNTFAMDNNEYFHCKNLSRIWIWEISEGKTKREKVMFYSQNYHILIIDTNTITNIIGKMKQKKKWTRYIHPINTLLSKNLNLKKVLNFSIILRKNKLITTIIINVKKQSYKEIPQNNHVAIKKTKKQCYCIA